MIRPTSAGVQIDVRVIPRAGRSEIAGERDGALLVRLSAPPVDGAANDELIQFVARSLDVPRRAVTIVSGEHSRRKRIEVAGLDPAATRARLNLKLDS